MAAYKWSADLSTFHDSGDTINGILVNFTLGTPSGGVVEVTANISEVVPERIFVMLEVTQQP